VTKKFATILLALSACGSPQTAAPTPKQAVQADASAPSAADAGERAPVESLDALATRGAGEVALMREAQRVADASKPYELRADKDVCVRALFAADRPVKAWIEDESKAPRGDVAAASTSSLVPPKGPACAKKGETLKLVIEGATTARAVIWQSP
jgi:hypothetical protein